MAKTRTDTLIIKLETDGSGKVKASLAGLEHGFERVDGKVKKSHSSLLNWSNLLRVVTVGAMAAYANGALGMADALESTADKLGLNIETLQEYRWAAQQSNVAISTMEMGLQRFFRRAAEAADGTGEAKGALAELGVQLTDTSGKLRVGEDLFRDVAEAISRVESPQERLRLAFKLFDSEGVVMVNMLRDGAAGLDRLRQEARDLGIVMDADLIRNAAEANTQLEAVWKIVDAHLTQALLELSPYLVEAAEGFKDLAIAAKSFFESLGSVDQMGEQAIEREIQGLLELRDSALERLQTVQRGSSENAAMKDWLASQFLPSEEDLQARLDEINRLLLQARLRQKELFEGAQAGGTPDQPPPAPVLKPWDPSAASAAQKAAATELEAYRTRLTSLIDALDPAAAKTREYLQAVADLDRAWASGLISGDEHDRLLQLLAIDTDSAREAEEKRQALMDEGARLTEAMRTPLEEFADELERYTLLAKAGAISQETLNRAVTDARERFSEAEEKAKKSLSTMAAFSERAAEGMHDAFSQFFFDPLAEGFDGALDGFTTMLRKMAAELAASEVMLFAGNLLKGSGSDWLSSLGSSMVKYATGLTANAKGNVFSGGRVVPFADGGIVTSPTLFPMRDGIGLMGEEDDEAILPLKRGRDGKLGVSGGGTQITIAPRFEIKAMDSKDVLRTVAPVSQELAVMTMREIEGLNLGRSGR
ncbi:phage tail tape measure protein [Thioalbus denitrificans]|uniref:Lambda family phage tail tape measure protein n=1 Tax=Thioalbus denitrificans TaxID=547122 RepID=A0A369CDH1_9GAMM|nr:phage tail tape measure protein [Thioalbus denitrificans]RCX32082.1 lambda family phage tail tape measure protein [Thioalbus denitrificans]